MSVSTNRDSEQVVWSPLLWAGDVARHIQTLNRKVNVSCYFISPDSFVLEPTSNHHYPSISSVQLSAVEAKGKK